MVLSFEDTLISSIIKFREIEAEALVPGLGKDALIDTMHRCAKKHEKIMTENNAIIKNDLRQMLNNITEISDLGLPWRAFVDNVHHNTASWIDVLVLQKPEHHSPEMAMRIYDSVKIFYI